MNYYQQGILIDVSFNVGSLTKFPKLVGHALSNNLQGMKDESQTSYTAGGVRKIDTRRHDI